MNECLSSSDFEQYDRGLVDPAGAAAIRAHLGSCARCAEAYDAFAFRSDGSGPLETIGSAPTIDTAHIIEPPQRHLPRIDGYKIINVLGQGGMGVVYRAVQIKLNRTVALKVLPAMIGAANPAAVSRFRREATSAARLHHTHIIPIYDFGECGDAHYYAMELIHGQPLSTAIPRLGQNNAATAGLAQLADLLRTVSRPDVLPTTTDENTVPDERPSISGSFTAAGRGRPYYSQVARWMADAADALHYAHNEGIIHRDIKPGNLILSEDSRIMVADFGLAKSTDDASVTMTGSLLGTLRYISPEQAMAKRVRVDHRTDIYSLGATLYELLAFEPAFAGNDDKEILGAIISRDPVPTRRHNPTVPAELETICMKMIEKSPEARYDTARAVAEDLRRYLNDIPIAAKRPGPLARIGKFARRHKAVVSAVVAGVLLVAATGFLIIENQRKTAARVRSLTELGLRLQNENNWNEARSSFEEALVLDPNNWRAMVNLALLGKEQYNAQAMPQPELLEQALEQCNRAIVLAPQKNNEAMWGCWNVKGVLLKKLGRYSAAVAAYNQAARHDPRSVATLDNLACVHMLVGDLDAAETTLHRAVNLTDAEGTCNSPAWRHLAVLRLLRRDPAALEAINAAVDCDKTDPWARAVRARIHMEIGLHQDTRAALEDAQTADSFANYTSPQIKRVRALAHLQAGEYAAARDSALAALGLGDVECYNYLVAAIASHHLGEPEAAAIQIKRAREAWPPGLTHADSFQVRADAGVLWFDAARDLRALLDLYPVEAD